MQIDDLTVEVRDGSLARIGQILPADLVGFSAVLRFNKVGGWALTLRADHPLVDTLRAPGGGLIVTGPAGVLLSGPTLRAKRVQTAADPIGAWELEGADDSVLLAERLAYPDPANAAGSQAAAYDVRTGKAETVAKGYVTANLGASALVARRVTGLTVEADAARGLTVTERARFDTLGELLERVVSTSGLGFEIEQSGSALVFKVYEPTDRSATIRMDVENERLTSAEYAYGRPGATHVVVAGQGEGAARTIVERQDAATATAWGRRVEIFKDQRNAAAVAELEQAGDELLAEKGGTIESISVTPSDDQTMRYGVDWGLGDRVTVVVGGSEISAIVTEAAVVVTDAGVKVGATVGNPEAAAAAREPEAAVAATQAEQGERISNLERNAEGGSGDTYNTVTNNYYDAMPAGSITAWGSATAPAGWLLCDGSAVSRSTYGALFAAIGTTYGAGDGSTTFNVPDLRGRSIVGRDASQTEFDTLGEAGGAKTHTLTDAEVPATVVETTTTNRQFRATTGLFDVGNFDATPANFRLLISDDTPQSDSLRVEGGGGAHNNLSPYRVLNFIIKHTTAQVPTDSELDPRVTALEQSPTFTGTATAPRLRLTATNDASTSSTLHALQVGLDSALNLAVDNNEIQARDNGAASGLNLNIDGGDVNIGSPASAVSIPGTLNGQVIEDTGWVTVSTFSDSFTGSNVAYRRINGVVYVRGELVRATAPTSLTTGFTLPAGYRPSTRYRALNWGSGADQPVGLSIGTDGQVGVICATARSATPAYHINAAFPAA